MSRDIHRIGIISDTHGLLRKEALQALASSDLLIHAGDIGNEQILPSLEKLAPVVAVKGNVDLDGWASTLPATAAVELEGIKLFVLHSAGDLDLDPATAGFDLVISGHSHKPGYATRSGVAYLNPGSAGPRRFRLPITLARLDLSEGKWNCSLIDLETGEVSQLST